MKRFALLAITVGTLGLGACADATAPVPDAQRAFQPTGASKTVTVVTGNSTDQFVITACNGELVTGTATHRVVAINAVNKHGTADAVAVLDQFNGTGMTTRAKYTGAQLTANAALITPEVTAFTTVSSLTLKGAGKIPDTYVNVVTLFAMDDDGDPAVAKVYYSTQCTSGSPSHHS